MFSCELIKINDAKKKQKRKFILTNQAIYNFDSKSKISENILKALLWLVKRKIHLTSIKAVTISTKSDEFVIHVDGDYDYLYLTEKYFNKKEEKINKSK